ncbi:high mobility group B protein 14-like [Phalaenopsis equestris]|uniref:high mobility group B protein 14-like n=1 Tax=Phalaenopsis equestris TaxID=78828 RepID=UPI0009E32E83|nr:high mobility group B protein 14-like [Phalaenopsis equestris]XP_020599631.1 high mobility group B protein 14-like [Phalaenopsis equestris]XP_020599632.1 high mobility group B protein 14-like [Phalaenopsis equestris]
MVHELALPGKQANTNTNCSRTTIFFDSPTPNLVSSLWILSATNMKDKSKETTPAKQKPKSKALGKKLTRKAKTKKKLTGKDPAKPKKPPTAFFYFLEDFRKTYQKENPDVKSMCEIGKACGEKWKTMTYEEKVAYYDIATEKRAEFEKAMSEYLKMKENNDLSEESYE